MTGSFAVYLDDAFAGERLAGTAPTLRRALRLARAILEAEAAQLRGVETFALAATVHGPSGRLCARLRPKEWA
jgi:hypothetical protein